MTPFAEWLRDQMETRRPPVRQSQLAAFLGTKQSTVSAWFTDDRIPRPDYCQRLADVLHVPVETVLRAAGHLPPATGPEPEIDIIPELGVMLRTFTPQEQRRWALPALAP